MIVWPLLLWPRDAIRDPLAANVSYQCDHRLTGRGINNVNAIIQ